MAVFAPTDGNAPSCRLLILVGWCFLVILVIYGVHLRNVAYCQTKIYKPIRADAFDYFQYAKNVSWYGVYSRQSRLLEGQITPKSDALRSPGFPAFASLFMPSYTMATTPNTPIRDPVRLTLLVQSVVQFISFSALTIMLIKFLGVGWSLPGVVILWTFPHFISMNTYYLSESLFISVLAIFVFCYWLFSSKQFLTIPGAIICGLVLGLMALIRPAVEYLAWFVAIGVLCQRNKNWRPVVLFLLAALLPVIAWKIRNLTAIGALSDPTLMINGLYHGSFPGFMFDGKLESLGFPYRFDPRADEVKAGLGATLALIGQRFWTSPLEYVQWYLLGKQFFLWRWDILAGQGDIFVYPVLQSPYLYLPDMQISNAANKMIHVYWLIVGFCTALYIAAQGLKSSGKYNPVWLLLGLIVIYSILLHTIVAPFPRYGIPFKLPLILLMSFGLKEFCIWLNNSKKSKLQ